ncbi:MAG: hypothetical protein IPJ97_11575 [Proteobacteria bacterium]|nr:hypothetical protein [Pseudomonadota bacterium]
MAQLLVIRLLVAVVSQSFLLFQLLRIAQRDRLLLRDTLVVLSDELLLLANTLLLFLL